MVKNIDLKDKKIYIAGHTGMVGTAVKNKLLRNGFKNLLLRKASELNLIDQHKVNDFFNKEKPEVVILAAGKVGGIGANKKYPADFIYNNLMIWTNVINAAANNNVEKLIFLGSSTIYPKDAPVPFKEEYLLSGPLDKNTEPYAIAKISAIKLCESFYLAKGLNFIPLTLANLYGPYDHFDNENAHVVPALISKIYNAKIHKTDEVILWGTGNPTRDLLFVEDLAEAIEFIMNNVDAGVIYSQGIAHLNVGTGKEHTIQEIAKTIADIINYEGKIIFDSSKPDGTMRKAVDTTRINSLGWKAKTNLNIGIKKTCEYYLTIKN